MEKKYESEDLFIRLATIEDREIIAFNDQHIDGEFIPSLIECGRIYLAYIDKDFIGWLRYGFYGS